MEKTPQKILPPLEEQLSSYRIIIPTKVDIEISEGKDLIVKGECGFVGTENVKRTLCEQYDAYTVSKVDRKLHGDLSNIEISCK
jgi:hypothetical protein